MGTTLFSFFRKTQYSNKMKSLFSAILICTTIAVVLSAEYNASSMAAKIHSSIDALIQADGEFKCYFCASEWCADMQKVIDKGDAAQKSCSHEQHCIVAYGSNGDAEYAWRDCTVP